MASWSTHSPNMCAGLRSRRSHRPSDLPTCSSRPCSPRPASHRIRPTSRSWRCSGCLACASLRPPELTSQTLCEEHGHRVLRVCGKGSKVVLVPLAPAVGRAIDQATGGRTGGPINIHHCSLASNIRIRRKS